MSYIKDLLNFFESNYKLNFEADYSFMLPNEKNSAFEPELGYRILTQGVKI